jgi:Fe-S cluster assembly protein SufD
MTHGNSAIAVGTETLRISAGQSPVVHLTCAASGIAVITVDGDVDQHILADVAAGASLTVIMITDASGANVRLACEGSVGEGGSMTWQCATLAAASVHHTIASTAAGDNATTAVDWLCAAADGARYTLDARNIFAAKNGRGEMVMRAVARERASVALGGKIDIRPSGGGTETYLTQHVLMLDPTAVIDAVPALEIHADSVKASHSATVSRLSSDDLFYVSSRGIPADAARALFIEGFLSETAVRFADAEVREALLSSIRRYGER